MLTFNIAFYLVGLTLAIAPFIIDFKAVVFFQKPLLYKISMPLMILSLIVMGIIKTIDDYKSQDKTINQITGLNESIKHLTDTVKNQKTTYGVLIKKLDSIGVKVKNNQPTIVKKNYYNHVENMRDMIQQ